MTREELLLVLEKHRMWLNEENGGERANLRSANLSSADLSYANLRYANFSSANLRYADLRYANLVSADLGSADLRSANLSSANLSSANLGSATGEMKHLKSIFIDTWPITYTSEVLQIGCERHAIDKWWQFTDEEISKMHLKALDWWNKYKTIIMQMIELSPAQPTGYKEPL